MSEPVVMLATTPAAVIVLSFCVPDMLCRTIITSLAAEVRRYDPIPFGYDPVVSGANRECHGRIIIEVPSSLAFRRYGENDSQRVIFGVLSAYPQLKTQFVFSPGDIHCDVEYDMIRLFYLICQHSFILKLSHCLEFP